MLDYVYVPTTQPMDIEGWPTLADMIISNKRVVVMLAYDADQQSVRCSDFPLPICNFPQSEHTAPADTKYPDPMATRHVVLPMANPFLPYRRLIPMHRPTPSRPEPQHIPTQALPGQPQPQRRNRPLLWLLRRHPSARRRTTKLHQRQQYCPR